ncbi:hypothetical protein GFK26_18510 [Variovorax paradoxus]|uniref:HK97 gp10 family phage protein n=1 Tax=Variovorax paradoxus TaxID=34073 RepID=A0A5Q0M4E7_VARPD|nr:hypothetical protein [Variovorax paradoxus]QFZ84620.1 hypothetical protein GFK26_18510 [Variovorax paradoxus]
MALRIDFNPSQLEANIRQITERAVKGMHLKAKRRALKVRDLAREYAPEKSGLLERNIEMGTYKEGGRNTYTVYVDLDAARYSAPGVLGDYVWLMEEELRPYGSGKYNLGVGSLLKRASTGKRVGGRFLRRAVQEGGKAFMDEMIAEVRKVTGESRLATMNYQRETPESDE